MVRSYYIHTRYGPSQDIFPRISVILYFISSRIISPTIHTFIYFASFWSKALLYTRRRSRLIHTSSKGSVIPPASTLGKVCTLQFDQWSYIKVKHSSIYRKHFILVIETLDATRQLLFEQRILSDSISNHPKHCYKRFLYRKTILNNHRLALHLTSDIREEYSFPIPKRSIDNC